MFVFILYVDIVVEYVDNVYAMVLLLVCLAMMPW